MKKSAQSSTQQFTEIQNIQDTIVILQGGNACLVISVTAVNFTLLSPEEQDAKVVAYASLLNSLSFPIQIVVRSKQVQITPYLTHLEQAVATASNTKLAENIKLYKEFVNNLVKTATVLDKHFFLVIPYSSLEGGIASAARTGTSMLKSDDFFIQAKAALQTKADSLMNQLDRLSLRAKILERNELVALFYDEFNQAETLHPADVEQLLAQLPLERGK
ncbi:MAG TPA: hypothetical protein VFQ63_00590 [Patescibacteria group bacterium]|nr:hypothetical protein [Patescibacteria group bacterium]